MGNNQLNQAELKLCLHPIGDPADDFPTKQQKIQPINSEATTATVRLIHHVSHGSSVVPLIPKLSSEFDDTPPTSPFPQIGSHLLHFQIEEEIGRGSFARVYLARQEALANRLVVLKVSTVHTDEPQTLARLRHTNIVPVYSVHKSGSVQVVCMPFLGRMTLGQVITNVMAWNIIPPDEGTDLLTPLGTVIPEHELNHHNYVEGCLWLIGQLSAGLAHAHSRGVLHQDLKPANVLITEDGLPMILDFNVASDGNKPSNEARIGGTLPYMSPEHLRQFLDDNITVDERSDLFSLGVILYQLLTGSLPYPTTSLPDRNETIRRMIEQRMRPYEPVRKRNSNVTPAMEAIVEKLLDPLPQNRYPSAEALREDIARQLSHQPLAYAPDHSFRERATKWRRRHPRLATGLIVGAAVLIALILPSALIAAKETQAAERALQKERTAAATAADATIASLNTAAVELGSPVDPETRVCGLRTAKEMIGRYGVTDPGWRSRQQFTMLDPAQQDTLTAAFAEVLVLLTRAEAAAGGYSSEAVASGLRWNSIARTLFAAEDRPAVLDRHRNELEARRDGRPVKSFRGELNEKKPHEGILSARDADLYFDGLDLTASGHYCEALPRLTRYCDRHPSHFRASFARGVCHLNLGQSADAAAAFGICLALLPDFPFAVANRGIARLEQHRYAEAEADFSRALELKAGWNLALLNRGIARLEQKRFHESAADFSNALADPLGPTRLYFLRSKARIGAGDAKGAEADRMEGMSREPRDALSWSVRGFWRMDREPQKALEDNDAALKLNPTLKNALLNKAIILADYLDREADAIPVLDRLLDFYPDHVESRAGRGVYLARLGRADEARQDAAAVLAADPTAFRKYQLSGLFAQLAKHDPNGSARAEALDYLSQAFRSGFVNLKLVQQDKDLDPIRNDPEFKRLVELVGQLARRN